MPQVVGEVQHVIDLLHKLDRVKRRRSRIEKGGETRMRVFEDISVTTTGDTDDNYTRVAPETFMALKLILLAAFDLEIGRFRDQLRALGVEVA